MRSFSILARKKKITYFSAALLLLAFLIWRFVRPMNIFVVTDNFARPMAITQPPAGLESMRAADCGKCHKAIYKEWAASMHAHAWTDPYYQIDRRFDDSQQICLNCHIPLQNQQPDLVTGFRDKERFKPILRKNPDFDPVLRQEGITCVVCHLRDGVINNPRVSGLAPHKSRVNKAMIQGVGVCGQCHVVSGRRWDTFFKIPPCGTVAEIKTGTPGKSIICITCHMPQTLRPLVEGGEPKTVRMHLWRGGHDPKQVRQAVKFDFKITKQAGGAGEARLTLTNTDTDHFLPTGTPDRYLSVTFKLRGADVQLKSKTFELRRTIMWRPFIVDLWDTRLIKNKPQSYTFTWPRTTKNTPRTLKITVRYHLLAEARRRRINYRNKTPISYIIYQRAEVLEGRRKSRQ